MPVSAQPSGQQSAASTVAASKTHPASPVAQMEWQFGMVAIVVATVVVVNVEAAVEPSQMHGLP